MSWTVWILLSSFFLALYDLAKKASVRENAVLPVLLCSTCCGCAAFVAGLGVCVKASSELYCPVSGVVIDVNDGLQDTPEKVNGDAYESWIIKVRMTDSADLEKLLSPEAYGKLIA